MECAICAKHRGEGPLVGPVVWADETVVVSHRPGDFPGYLFVETRRHVAALDELTSDEVSAVSRAAWCVARGLRAELAPEHVFSAIAGRSVAHFHQHVFVRHQETPEEFGWLDGSSWTGAPVVDIAMLCRRLAGYF
ncbi:histidine triad (HIT) protein [Amycolatopsis sp. WAC 04182]|uniref:HIT family protein n=1 Tax=Amycolatopsis sp. WAC 04182 TaxID=2203198 RepID=UPI000F77763A|nr:HIT domain-containing protein [Amycolatopsis sp. WAC 04182]RSN62988.1 histidine triad (HIT) protein [Amycolatopsis sp. WAC 04182]